MCIANKLPKLAIGLAIASILAACASSSSDPQRARQQITSCPPGMVLICTSNEPREPSSASDDEIPLYDQCRCEQAM